MFELVIFWIAAAFVLISLVILAVIYYRLYIKLAKVERRFEKIKDQAISASHTLHILHDSLDKLYLDGVNVCRDIMRVEDIECDIELILEEVNKDEFET